MKLLEREHGGATRISRQPSKLVVNDLQRSGSAKPNWDVEFGRLVDCSRANFTQWVLRQVIFDQLSRGGLVETVMAQPRLSGPGDVQGAFESLAAQWEAETEFLSMTPQIISHPAYLEIIRLGQPAVPLMLERLKRDVRPWFAALAEITHENPAERAETNSAAAEAWLDWGRRRRLID
ncbi:MAG TPA: hypothetical protein VFJ57_11390 [Solirubrobacterales bacterium]|nr:hypothetical protein [Solirubrobacterales bacterium]